MSQALTLIADRYRFLRPLGAGELTTVMLAEDELLRRRVAVKLMRSHGDEATVRRLLRAAKIGASLNHPNLVIVFDTLLSESELVVVMEYVEGETLARALEAGGVAPARSLEILRAVAAALDHAHEHGVVHRDLRPANILLGRNGVVKLAGLGTAQSADSTQMTQTGADSSSVPCMAPEQLMGHKCTPASDVYGLAAVACELLAGRRAPTAADPRAIVDQVVTETAPDLRAAWPDAPREVAEALEQGMARDPAQRPAGAGVFVDQLSDAFAQARAAEPSVGAAAVAEIAAPAAAAPSVIGLQPRPASTRPAPRRDGLPNRRLAILISVLALALVTGGLGSLLLGGGSGDSGRAGEGSSAQGSGDVDGRAQAPARGSSGAEDPDNAPPNAEAGSTGVAPPAARGGGSAAPADGQSAGAPQAGGRAAGSPDPDSLDATGAGAVAAEAESVTTPVGAVRAFYGRAARQDAVGVCALRGPRLQARFGCGELTAQFGTLRSVAFSRISLEAETARAATVSLVTTANHTGYRDRCRGSVDLVKGGAGDWLLDRLAVACTRS